MKNEKPNFNLVLSGGGVKGFAHLGLLKALEEAELLPDAVSGTSFGAIVGAYYCAGYTADETYNKLKKAKFIDPFSFTIRKAGLLNIEKLTEFYAKDFAVNSFEALQKKLYVTSSVMNKNKSVVHHTCNFPSEPFKDSTLPTIGSYVCFVGDREDSEINTTIKLLVRSSQIMLWHMSEPKFNQMDYLFCPEELSNVAFFDSRKIEEAYEIGYPQ